MTAGSWEALVSDSEENYEFRNEGNDREGYTVG